MSCDHITANNADEIETSSVSVFRTDLAPHLSSVKSSVPWTQNYPIGSVPEKVEVKTLLWIEGEEKGGYGRGALTTTVLIGSSQSCPPFALGKEWLQSRR